MPNDVNHDGAVTLSDAVLVINEIVLHVYSDDVTSELDPFEGIPTEFFDVREDGIVALSDAVLIVNELALRGDGSRAPLSAGPSTVPEPTSAWILLLSCLVAFRAPDAFTSRITW